MKRPNVRAAIVVILLTAAADLPVRVQTPSADLTHAIAVAVRGRSTSVRQELATLYEAKGVTPDKDVIAYCRIGERSSHSWFVLHELLGYSRVRNYDGSWTEYGSLIGVPIEKPAPVAAG